MGRKVRLRPKRAEDAWQDFQWRQDAELAELDASAPLDESFEEYQRGYHWELQHPSRHRKRFAVETIQGKHIGNVAYFDVDEKAREAQFGILIGDRDYWGKGYGTEAVGLVLDYMFGEAGMEKVYLRTLDWNMRAQASFGKWGFVPDGKLREGRYNFVMMRLARSEWVKIQVKRPVCTADDGKQSAQGVKGNN